MSMSSSCGSFRLLHVSERPAGSFRGEAIEQLLRFGVGGIAPDGNLQRVDRILRAAVAHVDLAEQQVCGALVRREEDRPSQLSNGLFVTLTLVEPLASFEV